jgi:CHAD domain-containing protein
MAFQLKRKESVSDGVKRSVRREIEKALDELRTRDQDEAVHEARKAFKKVRAALRLVRDELGDRVYRKENFFFRDAARPLTELRDAKILVEALDKLTEHFAAEIEAGAFGEVRKALIARQQAVILRAQEENRGCASVAEVVAPAVDRIQDWTIDDTGWSALKGGLKRVYRAGYRALAAAAAEPSVENLHEWRKQSKYLWHQLQFLEPAWIGVEAGLGDQVHGLTQDLGDDHDLAVLRQTVTADPERYGGHRVLERLIPLIDRRREDLQREAFVRGRRVYRDAPRIFMRRIKRGWKARAIRTTCTRRAVIPPGDAAGSAQ